MDSAVQTYIADIRAAFTDHLLGWWSTNGRSFPWRLPGCPPYHVFIAETLLKRTTATAVARIFGRIVEEYPDLKSLCNSTQDELASVLAPIGLQNRRAEELRAAACYLVKKHGGHIPNTLCELSRVPGVGDYVARAILTVAFGAACGVVDSNVERVLRRCFADLLPLHTDPQELQEIADLLLPETRCREYNWALLDVGSILCRPVRPKCKLCPLSFRCNLRIEAECYDASASRCARGAHALVRDGMSGSTAALSGEEFQEVLYSRWKRAFQGCRSKREVWSVLTANGRFAPSYNQFSKDTRRMSLAEALDHVDKYFHSAEAFRVSKVISLSEGRPDYHGQAR